MKKFALLASSLLFVCTTAFAAESNVEKIKAEARLASQGIKEGSVPFNVLGVGYTVVVLGGVMTITQDNKNGTTITGTR